MSEVIFKLGVRLNNGLKAFSSSLWTVFEKLSQLFQKKKQLLLIPAKKKKKNLK